MHPADAYWRDCMSSGAPTLGCYVDLVEPERHYLHDGEKWWEMTGADARAMQAAFAAQSRPSWEFLPAWAEAWLVKRANASRRTP